MEILATHAKTVDDFDHVSTDSIYNSVAPIDYLAEGQSDLRELPASSGDIRQRKRFIQELVAKSLRNFWSGMF